jgi:hypothetical protein
MHHVSKLSVACALTLGTACGPALASERLFELATVEKAMPGDTAWQALAQSPSTMRLDLVRARADAVAAGAESLRLDLAPGLSLTAHRLDSYTTETGSQVWSGLIEETSSKLLPRVPSWHGEREIADDPLNSVLLVRNGDKLTANITVDGQQYKLRPLHGGGHALVAVDGRRLPAEHPPEYARQPVIPMRTDTSAVRSHSTIRVMVHYTAAAASASGDMNGLIDLAIAESNQGYANSGVLINLQLAHRSQVSYTESSNFTTNLTRYRGTSDGYMDGIHTTRNSVAADVGVLIVNNSAYCGLASGIGSTASTAFAAVYWDCATGYYSFAHEIGHLQSARHDPANDPTNTPYTYGHGYQYPSGGWRTIMAYNCSSGCTRLNYWSNPSVTYGGVPMGTTSRSDNERVLNNTRATIAAFR